MNYVIDKFNYYYIKYIYNFGNKHNLDINEINKNKKMKINVTEQTTTFPYPLNKLKGNLLDNIGFRWATEHGVFGLDDQTIDWIIQNARVSMFNINRCYIYNKAYAAEFLEYPATSEVVEKGDPTVFDNIRSWAEERGIYDAGDSKTQYVKLMEEAGELAKALLDEDEPEIIPYAGGGAGSVLSLLGAESTENLKLLFNVKLKFSVRLGTKTFLLKDIVNWDISNDLQCIE